MSGTPTVAIFTSIPPRLQRPVDGIDVGPAYQDQCVESWLATGAPVYSLNSAAEIAVLQPRYPAVKFLPTRDAVHPLPAVAELLAQMADTDRDVCIFVNGDIRLNNARETAAFFAAQAAHGLLVVNRTNINELNPKIAVAARGCFDIVAISRPLVSDLDGDGYRLGEPWWDYWLPSCALLMGCAVRRHTGQRAYHLRHPQRWNDTTMTAQGRRFVAMMERRLERFDPVTAPAASREFCRLSRQLLATRDKFAGDTPWIYALGRAFEQLLNHEPIVPAA